MCGIVGYIGRRDAAPLIVEGLKKLEYRGYDSFGVATLGVGIDLDKLELERGQKVGTYFYTWHGEGGKSLQVAFTQGGQLIGYTNAGFFDNL